MIPSQNQQNNDGISFERYLATNGYPVVRRGNGLYIPGQYVVRLPSSSRGAVQAKPYSQNKSESTKRDSWKELLDGKEVPLSVYKPVKKSWLCLLWCRFLNWLLFWRPKRKCENELVKVPGKEFRIRIISVCHCCPLHVVQILNPNGEPANDIQDLLSNNAVIAPGGDNSPTSASLDVYDQNQYAFAFDHDQLGINQFEAAPNSPIDPTIAVQLYGEYNTNPEAVRVAVIDTGFRMSNIKPLQRDNIYIWKGGGGSSCEMTGDIVGWNFVGQPSIADIDVQNGINVFENNNPDDDNIGQHGTLISAIIANKVEQKKKEQKKKEEQKKEQPKVTHSPEIMVLKAFDSMGIGSMFTIVCAFCYAETHDVDVINASFVAPSTKAINYLDECLKRLEQKKVVIVCAAGNRHNRFDLNGTDLDNEPLYPACFSDKYMNIITVTSAWKKANETGSENYSENTVNMGVWVNHPPVSSSLTPNIAYGYFKAPYDLQNWHGSAPDGIIGSSFATPVVTGIVSFLIGRHNGIGSLITGSSNIRKVLLQLIGALPGPDGIVKDNNYVSA